MDACQNSVVVSIDERLERHNTDIQDVIDKHYRLNF